jgi:hypothetical protein
MTLFMILLDYKYRQTSRMAPPPGSRCWRAPEVRKAESAAGNAILISSNAVSEALHYSTPTGARGNRASAHPFNIELPAFTPRRDKEDEE